MIHSRWSAFFALLLPVSSYCQPWSFGPAVDVSAGGNDQTFHHLESAGRRNIAVSEDIVAVTWEDDRNGTPGIYLALKNKSQSGFSSQLKISAGGEAYEPSIAALTEQRFALTWEEDGQVHVRLVNAQSLSTPKLSKTITLPASQAMQAGILVDDEQLWISLSERAGRFNRIRLVQLKLDNQQNPALAQSCLVDPQPVQADQLYPTAVFSRPYLIVAWEDRRTGHTTIMASQSHSNNFCQFSAARRISTQLERRNATYGKGHGVSRVALGQYGDAGVFAAWADKRNFLEGYDIYAADYIEPGLWGTNAPVQDEFGGSARQWHTTVAGHKQGYRVVAWTDERDNNSDVFYSWFEMEQWSEDQAIPAASGAAEQSHPSMTLDHSGNIHIAWIERQKVGGATRLKYAFGQRSDKP